MEKKMELRIFTPEVAAKILALKNRKNRTYRPKYAEELAREMAEGRWRLVGDPIRFDNTKEFFEDADGTKWFCGELLDGQHRLQACVLSGIPLETYVITGLAAEDNSSVDLGLRRTGGDILAFAKVEAPETVSSAISHIIQETRSRRKPHGTEVAHFFSEHGARIVAIRHLLAVKDYDDNRITIFPFAIRIAMFFLFEQENAKCCNDFFTELSFRDDLCCPLVIATKRALLNYKLRRPFWSNSAPIFYRRLLRVSFSLFLSGKKNISTTQALLEKIKKMENK